MSNSADKLKWEFQEKSRLYKEVVGGCYSISGAEDAQEVAAILRALANELDPENKGDQAKGNEYVKLVKMYSHYKPHG